MQHSIIFRSSLSRIVSCKTPNELITRSNVTVPQQFGRQPTSNYILSSLSGKQKIKNLKNRVVSFENTVQVTKCNRNCSFVSPSSNVRCYCNSQPKSTKPRTEPIGPGPSLNHLKGHYPGRQCWSCNHLRSKENTLFCNFCEKIQPAPQDQSFFDLFSIPKSFSVDTQLLDKAYQRLQKQVHPDHFQRKSDTERDISAENSSTINEAYNTLKDPNERAKYLLKQYGIDVADESAGTIDDFELLSEIMEIRETIESSPPIPELRKLLQQNQQSLQEAYDRIGKAFADKDVEKAKNETIRVQYLKTLERELKERLPAQ